MIRRLKIRFYSQQCIIFLKGAFNVVLGQAQVGSKVVSHKTPALVSITGSVRAGLQLLRCSKFTKAHLELGGKAPVVVFEDADLDKAVEMIALTGYFNAGQDCTAATRVIVAEAVHDEFLANLLKLQKIPVLVIQMIKTHFMAHLTMPTN